MGEDSNKGGGWDQGHTGWESLQLPLNFNLKYSELYNKKKKKNLI